MLGKVVSNPPQYAVMRDSVVRCGPPGVSGPFRGRSSRRPRDPAVKHRDVCGDADEAERFGCEGVELVGVAGFDGRDLDRDRRERFAAGS